MCFEAKTIGEALFDACGTPSVHVFGLELNSQSPVTKTDARQPSEHKLERSNLLEWHDLYRAEIVLLIVDKAMAIS
jgi:hypothetical protein